MDDRMLEHPDVSAIERTGWPSWAAQSNRDTPESRREFAEDNIKEFLDFVAAGDEDLFDRFCEHYKWKYQNWMN